MRDEMRGAPTCATVSELLGDLVEDELGPVTLATVELHLSRCSRCRAELHRVEQAIALTGRLSGSGVSDERTRALLDAFRDWNARRHE